MTLSDLESRFSFHPATPENDKGVTHDAVRIECKSLALRLNNLLPEGREKSLAITHLEEVMFWANAAIARSE